VALELGERFLPRPTTTFTKRRLYCEGGKRGDEERQRRNRALGIAGTDVYFDALAVTLKTSPDARWRHDGVRAYLETLDGATLGELLLVLFGDLRSLTAHL
jgi:hypothetical protein